MKTKTTYLLIGIFLIAGLMSCGAKKCSNFSDPRNNYHARYDKKGLVKSKNKNKSRGSWNKGY